MKLSSILEEFSNNKKLVVVYGGRFQPFHKGHLGVYKWLCKKFSEENVWIATSNKTNLNHENGDISPFNFKEKKEIILSLYEINDNRIIQCKNPTFTPKEVFEAYSHYETIFVIAVGEKDKSRYTDSDYFKELPKNYNINELETKNKKGYYVVVPTKEEGISGAIVRDTLLKSNNKERKSLFKQFFGVYNEIIDDMIMSKLKAIK